MKRMLWATTFLVAFRLPALGGTEPVLSPIRDNGQVVYQAVK